MLARVRSGALMGIDAVVVECEVDMALGLPYFNVVGLPDGAVRESKVVQLSPAQRRVLIALCRPFRDDDGFATPASNQQIADELVLSVEAVKTHLRALFERFDVGDLPRQAKRAELVKRAFQLGAISPRDLDS